MTLTAQEQDSLRYHLGYGNIALGASSYSPDGYQELFSDVVSAYLSAADETSSTTSVSEAGVVTITPVSMTGIDVNVHLVVDVGESAEIVAVQAAGVSTFAARFSKAHSSAGYPIGTLRGVTRVRMLLWQADRANEKLTEQSVVASAGLKSVDKGDAVWFEGGRVLRDRLDHYMSIVGQLSSLIRVPSMRGQAACATSLEAY